MNRKTIYLSASLYYSLIYIIFLLYILGNLGKDLPRFSQIIFGHDRLSEEKFWKIFSFYDLIKSYKTIFSIKVNDCDIFLKSLLFSLIFIAKIDFQNYVFLQLNLALQYEENFVRLFYEIPL